MLHVRVCVCVYVRACVVYACACVRAERCGSTHSAGDGAARALQVCGAGGRVAGHTDSCSENAIGAHWIWRAGGGSSAVSSTMRAAVGIMRSCGFIVCGYGAARGGNCAARGK